MTVTTSGITITDHTGRQTEEELRIECVRRAKQLDAAWKPAPAPKKRLSPTGYDWE